MDAAHRFPDDSFANSFAPLQWYSVFLFSIALMRGQYHRFEFEVWLDFCGADDARDAALLFFFLSAESLFGSSFLHSLSANLIGSCKFNFLNM